MAKKHGNRSKPKRWQDDELKQFYSQYHKVGPDGGELASVLPGRSVEECEALCQQYQTFLSLPHNPNIEAAFVAMVKDVHKANDGDVDASRLAAAAAALAAVANGHQHSDSPDEQQQEEQAEAEADKTDTHQDVQQQPDDHQQQQQQHIEQHGIKEGSLAHRLAVELNGLSQGYSPGVGSQGGSHGGAVAGMYDTGDEGDGAGAASSPGARPQRLRKPKQYLGEPVTTPRAGSTRSSLPNTPGSSTRRKLARGAAAAAGRRRTAAGGVAAFYGGSPVSTAPNSTHLDSSSARKRRSRRLFEAGQLHDVPEHAVNQDGYGEYYDEHHEQQWEHDHHAYPGHVSDDVEEGVDALLSLASMAHASSSCQTGSQGPGQQYEDDGDYHQQQQTYGSYAAAGRLGRSRSHRLQQQQGKSSGMHSMDEEQDEDEEAEQQQDDHDDQEDSQQQDLDPAEAAATPALADSDAEDAAGGLAALKADGSQGWGTPRPPNGSDFIYRTGTPGGAVRGDFVLASPGLSDKHTGSGIPLPSPSGRGRVARAVSLFGGGAAGHPKSPGSRGRGGRRGRRGRGRGRSISRAGTTARESGSSGQRGGSAGGLEGGLSGSLDGVQDLGVGSDGEGVGASDEEPELMDAADLPATSAGPALSSPHLRTTSVNEPPRSVVLLGKRGDRDAADEDTPASHRSVRQRVDGESGSMPFNLPLPLFAAGGSGAAAAAELPPSGSDLAAAAAAGLDAADDTQRKQNQQQQRGSKAEEDSNEGRGTRGRSKRKQQMPAPVKNRRKPARGSSLRDGLRGVLGGRTHGRLHHLLPELPLPRSDAMLRHMMDSKLRRWVMYEWHYSAIDRPYFMRNEMQELLDASGLGHLSHLTRPEWSVLRGSFGRPRRLSLAFLKQERLKLEMYRERVRGTYEALGPGADVPADMPRQLRVAQPVVARHPATRSLHDGIILTLKPNKYRVQFNRTDLLSEVVRDTDVMPLDPSEALPLALVHMQPLLNGRPTTAAGAQALTSAAGALAARRRQQQLLMAAAQQQQMRAAGLSEQEARVDQQLLHELSGVLDRKEGLLTKLRTMNTTASTGGHIDPATNRPAETFQNSYAAVVSSLQAINGELQHLLSRLQTRSHLNMNPLTAAATVAGPTPAAAARAAPAAPADAAAAASMPVVAAGVGPLQPGVTMLLRRPSAPTEVAPAAAAAAAPPAAASASPTRTAPVVSAAAAAGVEVTPIPEVHPTSVGGGNSLVQDATTEARSMVQRIRALQLQQQQQTAADEDSPPAAAAAVLSPAASPVPLRDESKLDAVITGCVSMLVTVHKLTSPAVAGQQSAGSTAIESALEAALKQLRPKAAANSAAYADIMISVGRLKAQLAKAH